MKYTSLWNTHHLHFTSETVKAQRGYTPWPRGPIVNGKSIILSRACQTSEMETFLHTLLAPALGNANDQIRFPARNTEHREVGETSQSRHHVGLRNTFSWHISLANYEKKCWVSLGSLCFIPFQVGKIPCFKALFLCILFLYGVDHIVGNLEKMFVVIQAENLVFPQHIF